ncbi:MAG: hypothetical protein G01um101431_530 [Parcubacteria group bacterium Gr01-1014_31]|nr:MAG: hypothetical protein G01um101431_530 [Parcubacteria group bacterium Gr01-1014_31]
MSAALTLLLLLVWSWIGWHLCRVVLRESRPALLIPLSPFLGMQVHLLGTSLLGLLLPWRWAVAIALTGIVIATTALRNQAKPPLSVLLSPRRWGMFAAFTGLIILLYGTLFALQHELHWDIYWHLPLVSSIADGNYPVRYPLNQSLPMTYHGGADIAAASMVSLAHTPPWWAMHAIALLALGTTLLLSFALIVAGTGSIAAGWGGALLLLLGNSLAYVRRIFETAPTDAFTFLAQTVPSFGLDVLKPRTALAVPALLFSWYLLNHPLSKERPRRWAIIAGLCLGQLAFFGEEYALTFALMAAVFLWRQRRAMPQWWRHLLLSGVIAATLALAQGDRLTMVLAPSQESGATVTELRFRWPPGLPSWERTAPQRTRPLSDPSAWRILLEDFGWLLLIAPLLISLVRRSPPLGGGPALAGATIVALIPFILLHPTQDFNLVRALTPLRTFAALFGGAALGALWLRHGPGQRLLAALTTGVAGLACLGTLMFLLPRLSLIPRPGPTLAPAWVTPEERRMADIARQLLPRSAKVLTRNPIVVASLWGKSAPFISLINLHRFAWNQDDPRYRALLRAPTLEGLHALGITHVYVSPEPLYFALDESLTTDLYERDARYRLLSGFTSPKGAYRLYAVPPPAQ